MTEANTMTFDDKARALDDAYRSLTEHGKGLPYIGWYWRDVEDGLDLPRIGDCGEFAGIIQKNKWGYSERQMTEAENAHFRRAVEHAWAKHKQTGDAESDLVELWEWFQETWWSS